MVTDVDETSWYFSVEPFTSLKNYFAQCHVTSICQILITLIKGPQKIDFFPFFTVTSCNTPEKETGIPASECFSCMDETQMGMAIGQWVVATLVVTGQDYEAPGKDGSRKSSSIGYFNV